MDQSIGVVPESMNGAGIAATDSCIAVGTLCDVDGETDITLADEPPPNLPRRGPALDQMLPTPSKRLSVCSILDEALMVLNVSDSSSRVRIWTSDPIEPDQIWILAGG
jgi:hypothetical protein